MPRTQKFFVEFIALTIVSFLAANLWTRFTLRVLDKYLNSSKIDFVIATGVTISAVILMKTFFAKDETVDVIINKNQEDFTDIGSPTLSSLYYY